MSGPGYGNKTVISDAESHDNSNTRIGSHSNVDPYSGGSRYGSGATGGAGAGNKLSATASGSSTDSSSASFDRKDSNAYSGGTHLGSGTVGGAGWGNKTGSHSEDSTLGKLMEKAGTMMHKESLVEKGRARRTSAGYDAESQE